MNIPYVFKKCSKCGEWLVASSVNFHRSKTYKYGLNSNCKKCRAKHNKKYYEANKERESERGKKYRETHKEAIAEYHRQYNKQNKEARAEYNRQYYQANKEAINERHRQYQQDNKEAIAEYSRQYKEQNKEVINERHRQYYKENKEVIAEYSRQYHQSPQGQVVAFNKANRRRAREQNQGNGITKEQWLEMMIYFNWECAYSGKYLGGNTKDRTIDHIDPLNNGGENEIWNCIPMDRSLNSSKNDREMLDWYIKQPFCTAERLLKIYNWQEYAKKKYANLIVNE